MPFKMHKIVFLSRKKICVSDPLPETHLFFIWPNDIMTVSGRGGSDGCKIPMRVDSLKGLGVMKVECGSQFSVALTKSGAVYTW